MHVGLLSLQGIYIMIDPENKCVCKKSALHVKHKGGWMVDDEGETVVMMMMMLMMVVVIVMVMMIMMIIE